ncbi:MAG: LysR family transcriptional regulator [Pseudomonadota bacterium]
MHTRFHHHDLLRLFAEIAGHPSFSAAAEAMNMTKGAISYQIKTLETDLGVRLFQRTTRGVKLTAAGTKVLAICKTRYEEIEATIDSFRGATSQALNVGVSTYFAARWLSSRLMTFMHQHQTVQLRIQPMIQFSTHELRDIDLAIRWGNGIWDDGVVIPFMPLRSFPVGNADAARHVENVGMAKAISDFTLLRDRDDSNAWSDWLDAAALPPDTKPDVLIIPDPNVRVQAVINGQGIALMDDLVKDELDNAKLYQLSDIVLPNYGYFIFQSHRDAASEPARKFSSWLQSQS